MSVYTNELAKPLAIIFHQSLVEARLPQDWNETNVTPILKNGSGADVRSAHCKGCLQGTPDSGGHSLILTVIDDAAVNCIG